MEVSRVVQSRFAGAITLTAAMGVVVAVLIGVI